MIRFVLGACLALGLVLEVTCCVDSMTNGCSVPLNSSFPYKTVFHSACQRHDLLKKWREIPVSLNPLQCDLDLITFRLLLQMLKDPMGGEARILFKFLAVFLPALIRVTANHYEAAVLYHTITYESITINCHGHCHGAMHGWTRAQCDDGFYNDMVDLCQSTKRRKRRDIEDFLSLLRHKFKRNVHIHSEDDVMYGMWDSVCKFMASGYYTAVSYFGHNNYETVSPVTCNNDCVISNGLPNIS
eukprot:gene19014-20926_t